MTAQTAENQSSLKNEDTVLENNGVKQIQVLAEWKAPSRVFVTRSRNFWVNALSIAALFGLIFIFIQEWFLILAIGGLIFVVYVYSTVKPEEIELKITNRGFIYSGKEYRFEELTQFWFSENKGEKTLNLATVALAPGRLEILLGDKEEEKEIREILSQYLLEETPEPTFLDKASAYLSKKIPLDISQ
jgi:hypothetical protein